MMNKIRFLYFFSHSIFYFLFFLIYFLLKKSIKSLWYQFLEKFFNENKLKTLTDVKVPALMRDLLCSIVSQVLEDMSRHVAIDQLLEVYIYI